MPEDAKQFPFFILFLAIIGEVGFFGFVLFFFSGNIFWVDAWVSLILYGTLRAYSLFWFNKYHPEVLRRRLSLKHALKKDIVFISLLGLLFLALFIIVSLDGGSYRWTFVPIWCNLMGYLGLALGFIIKFISLKENSFAAILIKIEELVEHQVATKGPYAIVRHPMYFGYLLAFFSLPIALGSFYGLIPVFFMAGLFVLRIIIEERFLLKNLEGYAEYAQKVRKRLIPFIW
ncbi:MAG: isoprenylcysteine carboxylmethyltransferase family protein [Candidatus Lokiarchaeota archaeon]|nr:isoprenylcysteine carboxylmethyltransferase family protein [Candidatus Lokiarchaeota archaeon]